MDRSNVIFLVKEIKSQDEIGQFISTEEKHKVFCSVESVSGAEFFSAGESGIKPELKFTILRYEYHNEKIIEFDGQRYGVYRTFAGRGESLELYCERKSGVSNG